MVFYLYPEDNNTQERAWCSVESIQVSVWRWMQEVARWIRSSKIKSSCLSRFIIKVSRVKGLKPDDLKRVIVAGREAKSFVANAMEGYEWQRSWRARTEL